MILAKGLLTTIALAFIAAVVLLVIAVTHPEPGPHARYKCSHMVGAPAVCSVVWS